MSGTYQLDGALFPTNPIKTKWTQTTVGTKGTGEPVFINYWQCEMEFSFLTLVDKQFFYQKKFVGGQHVFTAPHPLDDSLTTVSGCYIAAFDSERDGDTPGYAASPKLIVRHILLTGTSGA